MKVIDLVKSMQKANDFHYIMGGHLYYVYSEETGTCHTYNDFIKAVKREFVNPMVVLNAEVTILKKGVFEGIYTFENELNTFKFFIS